MLIYFSDTRRYYVETQNHLKRGTFHCGEEKLLESEEKTRAQNSVPY